MYENKTGDSYFSLFLCNCFAKSRIFKYSAHLCAELTLKHLTQRPTGIRGRARRRSCTRTPPSLRNSRGLPWRRLPRHIVGAAPAPSRNGGGKGWTRRQEEASVSGGRRFLYPGGVRAPDGPLLRRSSSGEDTFYSLCACENVDQMHVRRLYVETKGWSSKNAKKGRD